MSSARVTTLQQWSSSRSPPDASPGAFSSSLTTTVFSQRSMRRLEASPRRAAPKGQQSFISRTAPHQGTHLPTWRAPFCVRDTRCGSFGVSMAGEASCAAGVTCRSGVPRQAGWRQPGWRRRHRCRRSAAGGAAGARAAGGAGGAGGVRAEPPPARPCARRPAAHSRRATPTRHPRRMQGPPGRWPLVIRRPLRKPGFVRLLVVLPDRLVSASQQGVPWSAGCSARRRPAGRQNA